MTFPVWMSLVAACVVAGLTPGAGAINTMSNSMRSGWRRSIWGILGQQLGLLAHVIIVGAGVGLIVAQSPMLFDLIRYLGAAYLAYLGVRMLLTNTDAEPQPEAIPTPAHESAWSMVRRGFWVNLLNPKSILFFLAFMPQFIQPNLPAVPQYTIFVLTLVVIDMCVMWFVFAGAGRSFRRLTATPRGRRIMNSIFGALFIAVAVLLLLLH